MSRRSSKPKIESRKLRSLVGVRLADDEHAQARAMAADMGITLQEFFRLALRDKLNEASAV